MPNSASGWACFWSTSLWTETLVSQVQPSPSLSSASTGLGPWGECAGAKTEPKKSERNWKENRERPVSSGSCSSLQFPPKPPAFLPSWVGESQALYWTQPPLLPLKWGQSHGRPGGQVGGKWKAVPQSPHCSRWFPWQSCNSRCHHW